MSFPYTYLYGRERAATAATAPVASSVNDATPAAHTATSSSSSHHSYSRRRHRQRHHHHHHRAHSSSSSSSGRGGGLGLFRRSRQQPPQEGDADSNIPMTSSSSSLEEEERGGGSNGTAAMQAGGGAQQSVVHMRVHKELHSQQQMLYVDCSINHRYFVLGLRLVDAWEGTGEGDWAGYIHINKYTTTPPHPTTKTT
jgi:hypothetical protein